MSFKKNVLRVSYVLCLGVAVVTAGCDWGTEAGNNEDPNAAGTNPGGATGPGAAGSSSGSATAQPQSLTAENRANGTALPLRDCVDLSDTSVTLAVGDFILKCTDADAVEFCQLWNVGFASAQKMNTRPVGESFKMMKAKKNKDDVETDEQKKKRELSCQKLMVKE